jgi:Ribonuclease G/E
LEEALGTIVAFSGGRLHIEATQALTAVDVDGDPELGFAQVNRRAAALAMRQVRLREIGGIVVIDPAGPSTAPTAKAMVATLEQSAQADPLTVKVATGGAGLVTLIREARRPSLAERLGAGGTAPRGFAPSVETAALQALSRCVGGREEATRQLRRLEVAPDVAHYLQETESGRAALQEARRAIATDFELSARNGLAVGAGGPKPEGGGRDG